MPEQVRTKSEIIDTVFRCIPFQECITDIDTTSVANSIQFTWRGIHFLIDLTGDVRVVMPSGKCELSNNAILLRRILRTYFMRKYLDTLHSDKKQCTGKQG